MTTATRILIAGANGFVGSRLAQKYPQAVPIPSQLLHHPGEELRMFVAAQEPQVILNAAAISDIGTCEKDPEGSYQANVLLPAELAMAAKDTGAKLVSFSSDQVYTGCSDEGPYREIPDLPEPASVYARHKLEAERRVLDIQPEAVLLRATWMYDMPIHGHRNRGNFLVNTLNAVIRRDPILVPAMQYRGITYVRQVAASMDPVIALPGGVYNYGSENPLTMAETARALLDALKADAVIQDTGARRHNLWMDCGKLKETGIFFDTTAQGFARCIRDYCL